MPALADLSGQNNKVKARQIIESFCKAEFEGDEFNQRIKIIKFSPEREKKEKKRTGPASPWVVFWDWDPFYIVSSFKILDIDLKNNKGTATVEYARIAQGIEKGEQCQALAGC